MTEQVSPAGARHRNETEPAPLRRFADLLFSVPDAVAGGAAWRAFGASPPEQSWSIPSPGMSVAPGRIEALWSSQSALAPEPSKSRSG